MEQTVIFRDRQELQSADLNNALVSYILTGYAGFTTSAGHLGPHCRVDHDISMLVPRSGAAWKSTSANRTS